MAAVARILSIEPRALHAGPPVQIIRLQTPADYRFLAGQYLEILPPDGPGIPLSIASAPETLPFVDLHYRSTPGLPDAARLDSLLTDSRSLSISEAGGGVILEQPDERPLMLIAGGTGVAQALCLAHAQTTRHPSTSVRLLACADHPQDFYFSDLLPDGRRFECIQVADNRRTPDNRGLRWLHEHAVEIGENSVRTILAGSPPFVYAATDTLVTAGVAASRLESDVYAYAPR